MKSKQQHRAWHFVAGLVAAVVSIAGVAALVLQSIHAVKSGRGLETWRTFDLVEFNHVGFLVLLGALVIAIVVGIFARYREHREHREWRELEEKYGSNESNRRT